MTFFQVVAEQFAIYERVYSRKQAIAQQIFISEETHLLQNIAGFDESRTDRKI